MPAGSLSRRYAKALLSLGVESQTYDAIGKEIDRMATTITSSDELRAALGNPSFSGEKRRGVVEDLIKRLALSKPVRSFVLLLLDKGRLDKLPDIARAYQGLVDEHANRVRATVTSAKALDPATADRIKKTLEKQTGKTVVLEQKTDPSLLGGMTTQLGDTVYDGSVRTQLEQLRASLLN
jgi:F-type H+-transporting ATPase subunit delta